MVNLLRWARAEKSTHFCPVKEYGRAALRVHGDEPGYGQKTPFFFTAFSASAFERIIGVDLRDTTVWSAWRSLTRSARSSRHERCKAIRFHEEEVRPMGREPRVCAHQARRGQELIALIVVLVKATVDCVGNGLTAS